MFPTGGVSFADAVESYSNGDPSPIERRSEATEALGVPDYTDHDDGGYVSLGCAGELVLRFEDNALVDVAGHTGAVGSAASNEKLSRKRARAVAGYLGDEAGFSRDRVRLEAHRESRPVASNETAQGRSQNRRVELTVKTARTDTRLSETATINDESAFAIWSMTPYF